MRCPHLHCQPLNEVWEGVDPGFSPSGPSGPLHAAELPWVGPAFPPGAPSLLQATTQHFCSNTTLTLWHSISTLIKILLFQRINISILTSVGKYILESPQRFFKQFHPTSLQRSHHLSGHKPLFLMS